MNEHTSLQAKPKLTAAQIASDCPPRLRQIGKEIEERLAKADKQTQVARDHLIAIEQLLAEAKGLCDGGGFKKFRELLCPQLGKSQAYALLAIAAGKKTFAEHRADERERKRRSRANQKALPTDSGTVPEKADVAKDEQPRGAAAPDHEEGFDQVERLLEEIKQIVSAYDDHDRLMLRRGYEPHLDGFIDEKGKRRFKPSQHDADELPQSSGGAPRNGTVSPEQSAEDMKRKFEALEEESTTPADVASTS
jgi:hypothetical protein